jgi:hypothetical protein
MAVGVRIDSGPVKAADRLDNVPREKWHDLMRVRAHFLATNLSYDCRCLVQFVADAETMHSALGFASPEAMIRDGYRLELQEIAVALDWLKLNPPNYPIPLELAQQLAAAAVMKDAKPVGQHGGDRKSEARSTDQVANGTLKAKGSNQAAYLAARIKKVRPDIAAAVERGEYRSMRAAAISAGIITPPTPLQIVLKLLPQLSDKDWQQVLRARRSAAA